MTTPPSPGPGGYPGHGQQPGQGHPSNQQYPGQYPQGGQQYPQGQGPYGSPQQPQQPQYPGAGGPGYPGNPGGGNYGGYGGMPPGPNQGGSGKGPLIAVVIAAIVVVGGIIATLVVVLGGDDEKTNKAGPTGSSTASSSSSASSSPTTTATRRSTPTTRPTTTRPAPTRTTPRATSTSDSDLPDQVEAVDLAKGECIDLSSSGDIDKKSCSSAHDGEVFMTFDLTGSVFPGEAAIRTETAKKCGPALEALIGSRSDAGSFGYTYLFPQSQGWTLRDDRSVTCIAQLESGQKLTKPLS